MLDIFTIKQWLFILCLCNIVSIFIVGNQIKERMDLLRLDHIDLGQKIKRLYNYLSGDKGGDL